MKKILFFLMIFCFSRTFAQDKATTQNYFSFKTPAIEDNSFLVEEAFNQGPGVVQFIQSAYFEDVSNGDFTYSYSNEIPVNGINHQFSYSFNFHSFSYGSGFGDFMLNYRYQLFGKEDWLLMSPRFSVIIPTGDYKKGFGDGASGGQFNLPVSKLVSNSVIINSNAGYTFLSGIKSFDEKSGKTFSGNISAIHVGCSAFWMPCDYFNLMLEYYGEYENPGKTGNFTSTLNPGMRFAFNSGKTQLVPGVAMPITFDASGGQPGLLFYLSIEPDFTAEKQ